MKRTLLVLTTAALALTSTLASAQGYRDWNDRRGGYDNHRYDNRRGPSWQRGQYLPPQFRGHDRYVRDWGRYRLSAPPRGYGYYRQDNGDFVLAAIATGLIASLSSGGAYGYAPSHSYAPAPYVASPPIYRDGYGRAYTIDRYGRSVWVR